jgi:hypothetical protein
MAWVITAIVGTTAVTGYLGAQAQKDAANTAADAQGKASQMSVDEIKRQFDSVQSLMKPYVDSGVVSLQHQGDLIGLNGNDAQQAAITNIQNGPQYQSLINAGEGGILANASATGGLRGGNTQQALAQLRPSILSGLINDRFSQLGSITGLGQAAAGGQAAAAQNTGSQVAAQYGQMGSAQANAALAGGRADAGFYGGLGQSGSTLGLLKLLKGF